MATAKSIYQPQGWSQRNQRADAMFTDQHGREYFGSVELKTGDVVGLMEPQFTAPIVPDQKYLERNVKNRPYDLYINYERWLADIRGARRDWEREGRQMMRKMRGASYDPAEAFGADVLDILGPPPQAIEPVIAAKQGNSFILGFTRKVDRRLVEFLEPEQLPADERVKLEPDFRDEDPEVDAIEEERIAAEQQMDFHDADDDGEDEDPKVRRAQAQQTAPRIPVRRNRPEPRAATKGTGSRKGHPPKSIEKPKRERYPKGHPKAGQFIPLKQSA